MKPILRLLPLFLCLLVLGCQKEIRDTLAPTPRAVEPHPITAHLQGNVLDENGQPAAGARVTVGSQSVITDARGYFRINRAELDKEASLVTAEKGGYFRAFRTFSATSGANRVQIKLVKKTLAGTVNAVAGGEVSLSNGTKIQFPANGVVEASGSTAYTGTVNVYAAYIDPTASDILQTVPGSFMGDDRNNRRSLLTSYGMLSVELESASGSRLQLKSGAPATLTVPIPSSLQASAPANIPLWYVDETTGLWKEEGAASRNGSVYVGAVRHFTYWNCDMSVPTIPFTATLKTSGGDPLVNVLVTVGLVNDPYNYGVAHGFTDSLGQVSGPIPANRNLVLRVLDPCGNVVYSQNIGPYTNATDLGLLTVNPSTSSVLTVKGKVLNCSGAAVGQGRAFVIIDNYVRNVATDANGNFSLTLVHCNASGTTVQALPVDEASGQQGNPVTVPLTLPLTNVGNLTACGTSASQYINYSIDGVSHTIDDAANDSLMAYTQPAQSAFNTSISGLRVPNSHLYLNFNHATQSAGTYPVTNLVIDNQISAGAGLNVVITSFPQAIGQFYEGSVNGQATDLQGVSRTISVSFRIRRMY